MSVFFAAENDRNAAPCPKPDTQAILDMYEQRKDVHEASFLRQISMKCLMSETSEGIVKGDGCIRSKLNMGGVASRISILFQLATSRMPSLSQHDKKFRRLCGLARLRLGSAKSSGYGARGTCIAGQLCFERHVMRAMRRHLR